MTNILQVLLGLALVNYFMFDVVAVEARPTAKPVAGPGRVSKASLSVQLHKTFAIVGTTAVAFLLTLVISALFEQFVLFRFTGSFFSILVFVVVLAGVLQLISPLVLKRYFERAAVPGILLPLLFINCVVMGVTIPLRSSHIELGTIFVPGLARCAGFALVLLFFTVLRERLNGADIPTAFRGAPATLLTAALVSMTFMGFAGLT
jgi:Na+-translocating ferredoxin:NAD+ oxidoreductase subunit A